MTTYNREIAGKITVGIVKMLRCRRCGKSISILDIDKVFSMRERPELAGLCPACLQMPGTMEEEHD